MLRVTSLSSNRAKILNPFLLAEKVHAHKYLVVGSFFCPPLSF